MGNGAGTRSTLARMASRKYASGGGASKSSKSSKSSKASKGESLSTRMMNERFIYGGQVMTRAQIIADLKAKGGTPAMIDRYQQGMELTQGRHGLTEDEATQHPPAGFYFTPEDVSSVPRGNGGRSTSTGSRATAAKSTKSTSGAKATGTRTATDRSAAAKKAAEQRARNRAGLAPRILDGFQTIARVPNREIDIGAPPDARVIRATFGDQQMRGVLSVYGLPILRLTAEAVGAKPGRSKAETVQRIYDAVTQRETYDQTLQAVGGERLTA